MTEDIKVLKAKVMQFMEQEVGKYGSGRMDVKQVGELADVIKDLAEAEYYCTVAEAMTADDRQEPMGYTQPTGRMGYGGNMRGGSRQGYGGGMMGHTDPMQVVRDMMATNPELRSQLRNELL